MTETICHCFNHTDTDIRADLLQHGHATILASIRSAKRFGRCSCRTMNPKGT